MSALTPEAARAAAEWLETTRHPMTSSAQELRAEADRLEAAARTPGQVLCDAEVTFMDEVHGVDWEKVAAAVIAHHVGPDRVVVDRVLLTDAHDNLFYPGPRVPDIGDRLREAL